MVYFTSPYKPVFRGGISGKTFFSFGPQVSNGSISTREGSLLASMEHMFLRMGTVHRKPRSSLVKRTYLDQLQSSPSWWKTAGKGGVGLQGAETAPH